MAKHSKDITIQDDMSGEEDSPHHTKQPGGGSVGIESTIN